MSNTYRPPFQIITVTRPGFPSHAPADETLGTLAQLLGTLPLVGTVGDGGVVTFYESSGQSDSTQANDSAETENN